MRWRGPEVLRVASDAAWRTMTDGGEKILNAAKQIVPHDTGTLQRSGSVKRDRAKGEVTIEFGPGGAESYASVQHEREDYRHAAGREAKYLKKPFDALSPGIIAQARREIKSDLRRKH